MIPQRGNIEDEPYDCHSLLLQRGFPRLQCRDGKPRESPAKSELWRQSWVARKIKVASLQVRTPDKRKLCRDRTLEINRGSPGVFKWVLYLFIHVKRLSKAKERNTHRVTEISTQHLHGPGNGTCSHEPEGEKKIKIYGIQGTQKGLSATLGDD